MSGAVGAEPKECEKEGFFGCASDGLITMTFIMIAFLGLTIVYAIYRKVVIAREMHRMQKVTRW